MGKTTKQTTATGDEIEITQNEGLPETGTHLEDEDRLTDDPLGDYQRRTQNPPQDEEDDDDEDETASE